MKRLLLIAGLALWVISPLRASYLGGANDYISFGTSATNQSTGAYLVRLNPTSSLAGGDFAIFYQINGGGTCFIGLQLSFGTWFAGFYNACNAGADERVTGAFTLPSAGSDHAIGLRWDGSNQYLYMDGVQLGSHALGGGNRPDLTGFTKTLGNYPPSTTIGAAGKYSHFAEWNSDPGDAAMIELTTCALPTAYPTGLIHYVPMITASLADTIGSENGTATGYVFDAANPTIAGCGGGPTPSRRHFLGWTNTL